MGTEVRLRKTLVADVTDIGGSEASLRWPYWTPAKQMTQWRSLRAGVQKRTRFDVDF